MAERTVTVRLKAVVDSYQKAMRDAASSTQDVAKQADNWKNLGRSTAALGDSLTRNVTLPIVAVGAAATKMALDFDSAFVQMQTLAGVSADEVEGLKESVLGLAGETGKAPQELAEALYFVRSSGLEGAAAMDALEMAAKGSAAGLGSTIQVADALTSAMNAYAESGLTAAEATDVLITTAQEGKVEPAELAAQMGRLVPVAAELGISFNDVGAAIATISLVGNDASTATTQLSNVMAKLMRPSQQAQEALAEVGISVEDIRTMLSERGLLATLETLKASLGDAGFTKFLEDTQAVQGATALLGGDIDETRQRFEDFQDVTGATENAFSKWADSMGAKNAKAFADLQVALIRLGDVLAPIAVEVMGFAAGFLRAFDTLPGPVKTVIIALTALVAALWPIFSVGGRVMSAVASITKAFTNFAVPAGAVSGAFNQVGETAAESAAGLSGFQRAAALAAGVAGLAGLALAMKAFSDAQKNARLEGNIDAIVASLGELPGASNKALQGLARALDHFGQLDDQVRKLADTDVVAAAGMVEAAEAAGISGDALDNLRSIVETKRQADVQAAADQETNTAAVEDGASAFDDETAAINQTVAALGEYSDALAAQFDPLFGMMDAIQANSTAQGELRAKTLELIAARREHGENSDEAREAEEALTDAQNNARTSVVDLAQAATSLKAAMVEQGFSATDAKNRFIELATQSGYTREEANRLARQFGLATTEANRLGGADPTVDVSETGAEGTRRSIRAVEGAARAIPSSRHVSISASDRASGVLGYIQGRLAALQNKTITVTTLYSTQGEVNRFRAAAGRQHGGPIDPHRIYMVGEAGPELFVSDAPGRIIPNHDLDALSNARPVAGVSGGGGGDTYFVDMRGSVVSSEQWIMNAWNRLAAQGRANIRGRVLT